MIFDNFTIYNDCEPAGVELPKIFVEEDILKSIDSKLTTQSSSYDLLKSLARNGLREKGITEKQDKQKYFDRTIQELETLEELGFTDYILLNWDILNFCHRNSIPTGAGRGCFVSGQSVKLHNGDIKNIEDVLIGDTVLDHNSIPQLVEMTLNYDVDEEVIIIQFENGSQVKCTQDHEFYTENRGWVKAFDLNEFDDIREI
jgi:hypothetical protein